MRPRLIALMLLCAAMHNARAGLEVVTPTLDVGTIRGGAPLSVNFNMTNTGSEPLEILEVNRGCNCLAARLDNRILAPGAKASLTLEVRTLGHADGPQAWTTIIHARSGAVESHTPLAIHAQIINDITVQPAVCAFVLETILRQEIILRDRRQPALVVTGTEASTPAIKVRTNVEPGGITRLTLEVAAPELTPGRHDEMLSIYTDDPLYRVLQVPVTLTRLKASAVLVTPDRVDIAMKPGEPIPASLIRLRPNGEQAVVVETATADDPAVSATFAAGPGKEATLRIHAKRPLQTTVRVQLREPTRATVLIPVDIRDGQGSALSR